MASTVLEILTRAAAGALVVSLTLPMFDRTTSHAAILKTVDLKKSQVAYQPPRLGPPPTMIGMPVTFEGDQAARFPSETWRVYMNGLLAQMGYDPIDGCKDRLKSDSFSFIEDCDGNLVFVSNIKKASASMMTPKTIGINVRTGEGLPRKDIVSQNVADIVDRSAMQRISMSRVVESGSVSSVVENALPPMTSAYVDESVSAILNSPVPQTRRRPPKTASAE